MGHHTAQRPAACPGEGARLGRVAHVHACAPEACPLACTWGVVVLLLLLASLGVSRNPRRTGMQSNQRHGTALPCLSC